MLVMALLKAMRNGSLVLLACLPFTTIAQTQADPPGRVARLNYFDGTVTFAPAGSDDWAYAYLNRPLTAGDRLWVDQGGRSELHLGSTALRVGDQTSLDILALDDSNTQLKLTQGTLNVRIRALFGGESFEIDTPNLAFTLQSPGEYRIDVDPNSNITTVTVRQGNGTTYGNGGNSFIVQAQQQVQFSGTSLTQAAAADAPPYDRFDHWIADRDRREDASISARYVSREIIGYEELDAHGTWRQDPGYGAIWIPRITIVNWAPYHYGHWAWVAPWGWTWVDDEPWGFAPCHYGRWAWVQNSWAWVPGPLIARPVYAPALVAFAGGTSWSVSLTAGSPGVAWFPLAPGEAYHPAYVTSPTYVNAINKTVTINKTVNVTNNITNNVNVTKTVYINQQVPNAVTAMPAAAFVKGQAVQKAAINVQASQLTNAQIISTPALAPVKQSLVGNAAAAIITPPRIAMNRSVMATRVAAEPPAFHDALAQKFASQGGTTPGAGPAFIHTPRKVSNMAPVVSVVSGHHAINTPANSRENISEINGNRTGLDANHEKSIEGGKSPVPHNSISVPGGLTSNRALPGTDVPRPPAISVAGKEHVTTHQEENTTRPPLVSTKNIVRPPNAEASRNVVENVRSHEVTPNERLPNTSVIRESHEAPISSHGIPPEPKGHGEKALQAKPSNHPAPAAHHENGEEHHLNGER